MGHAREPLPFNVIKRDPSTGRARGAQGTAEPKPAKPKAKKKPSKSKAKKK